MASIRATTEERAGKIRGAAFEARSIIEDFIIAALGGFMGAWILDCPYFPNKGNTKKTTGWIMY